MSFLRSFVFIVAALLVINYVSGIGHGNCPPKNKVNTNKPACFSDSDCQKWGKVCCPNQYNTKSCVDRAPWNSGDDQRNKQKYTGGVGGGVYCEGVKCRPYEVCKPDPITKRLKCQRA